MTFRTIFVGVTKSLVPSFVRTVLQRKVSHVPNMLTYEHY